MARRKYLKDYRPVETVDERGRIRTEYEYIGAGYRYARGLEAVLGERRRVLLACGAGWLAFVIGLLPRSAASYAMYVMLPYVFSALPLGLVTGLLLPAENWKEPFRRQHADRLENRYPPAALACAVLAAVSLAGELVCLLRGGAFPGDAVFSLCAAVLCAAGAFSFSRRGCFQPEKL